MTTSTVVKKDIQKLQRAIVDGLEDVKAQDIQVFDTELQSALFERVIVASGTSNRQTKALAASVRDAVREAGFPKPRVEGEANGEWIIVDCSQAVVHIMQPSFRTYYNLEELWGDKPVRLKLGASKPVAASAKSADAANKPEGTLKRSSAAKKGVAEAFPSKAQLKKAQTEKATPARAAAKKSAAKPAPEAPVAASKPAPRKTVPSKAPATKTVAAKSPAAKTAAPKVAVKVASKVLVVKPPVKTAAKVAAKKAAVKKAPARKA
jgi:ribosome-associated protein